MVSDRLFPSLKEAPVNLRLHSEQVRRSVLWNQAVA